MQEFDLREANNGYTGSRVFEDDDFYISLCMENSYKSNKPVAIVELKRLNIRVLDNENLYTMCQTFLKDKDSKRFGDYVLGNLRLSYQVMIEFYDLTFQEGKRKGKNELRESFKELMQCE